MTSGGTSLATTPGPSLGTNVSISSTAATTANGVTITGIASAGAAPQSYYIILTYTNTTGSNESLSGAEFIVNCSTGWTFSVNVASATAPAGAATYAYYAGIYSGGEALQQATRYTTNLGTAFTNPIPLTNNVGITRAASSASSSIVGIALNDAFAQWETGVGGSSTAGGINTQLGAWVNPYPLGQPDPGQSLIVSLLNGQQVQLSLIQPWYPSLQGAAVGITLSSGGYFQADTTATPIGYIVAQQSIGPNTYTGIPGDTNALVNVVFTSGVI
jgi:hypothetical protein